MAVPSPYTWFYATGNIPASLKVVGTDPATGDTIYAERNTGNLFQGKVVLHNGIWGIYLYMKYKRATEETHPDIEEPEEPEGPEEPDDTSE